MTPTGITASGGGEAGMILAGMTGILPGAPAYVFPQT